MDAVSGLIVKLYDAAVDPALWDDLIDDFRSAFDGVASVMILQETDRPPRVMANEDRSETTRDYATRWAAQNPLLPHLAALAGGSVTTASRLIPDRRMEATAYHDGFLRKHDVPQMLTMKLWKAEGGGGMLNIKRSRAQRAFGDDEIARGRALVPHLRSAVSVASRLSWSGLPGPEAGEGAGGAYLVLDQLGRARVASPAAETILDADDGLSLDGGVLRADRREDEAALRRAVCGAVGREPGTVPRGGAVLVPRPSGLRAYAVTVTPLRRAINWLAPLRPHALVTIIDPEAGLGACGERVRALYGLTPSETALALGIAEGRELKAVARDLRLTECSARQYLSRVFAKTDTRRQHELARLIERIGAAP